MRRYCFNNRIQLAANLTFPQFAHFTFISPSSHSHKTRARKRDTQRQIIERRRKLRRANELTGQPRFPAIALVYDPQGFCEKMLNRLKKVCSGNS